jgi:hypothetical protein
MLDGGVGNIRLRPVLIQGREFMFMSASANGICHQGFPVAVPLDIYGRCIEQIRERGAVVRTLTGQIKIIPKEIADIYAGYVNVPKLYLQVEEAELPSQRKSRTVEDLEISVAVSFQGVVDDKSGIYATYATFDPSNPMSFSEAIDWMRDEYVRSYKGIILTDFDEHENHFSEARFSLKKVMQLDLEAQDFKVLNIGSVDKFISFQQTIREQTNYNVAGGNIGALGDGATATNFTQLAKPHRSVPNRKPSKGRRL